MNNGIAILSLKTGHSIAWDKAKITDRETHWQRRKVKDPSGSEESGENEFRLRHSVTLSLETI